MTGIGLWLLVLGALVQSIAGGGSGTVRAESASAPPHAPTGASATETVAALEDIGIVTAPEPSPSATPAKVDPRTQRIALEGIETRWTGSAMEIVLRSDAGQLPHRLSLDDNVRGYVLDLPGRWTLPATLPTTHNFERSNLQRMRIGRHNRFLRIVFSLREPAAPAPVVKTDDGGTLRILIR